METTFKTNATTKWTPPWLKAQGSKPKLPWENPTSLSAVEPQVEEYIPSTGSGPVISQPPQFSEAKKKPAASTAGQFADGVAETTSASTHAPTVLAVFDNQFPLSSLPSTASSSQEPEAPTAPTTLLATPQQFSSVVDHEFAPLPFGDFPKKLNSFSDHATLTITKEKTFQMKLQSLQEASPGLSVGAPSKSLDSNPSLTPKLMAYKPPSTKEILEEQVAKRLRGLGTQRQAGVDEELVPLLKRLDLDPVEFFTARACWQGNHHTGQKRRPLLEQVLGRFPDLPSEQKNWRAALAKVKESGVRVSEADEYFVGYFFDNRKKLKSLMRATLPASFRKSETVTVYRGQSSHPKYGEDSTKPLGCYTLDPRVARSFGSSNVRKYQVSMEDVWSTSFATQNNYESEVELTVFSPGGVREGERVEDFGPEIKAYKERMGEA